MIKIKDLIIGKIKKLYIYQTLGITIPHIIYKKY